jgi:hypothetical protein
LLLVFIDMEWEFDADIVFFSKPPVSLLCRLQVRVKISVDRGR